jgi:hypothetical protein
VPRLNQAAAVPDLADFDCRKANAFHKSRDSRTRILMVARDDPVGRHRRAWAGAILERQLIEGLDQIRARPPPLTSDVRRPWYSAHYISGGNKKPFVTSKTILPDQSCDRVDNQTTIQTGQD